MRRLQKDMTAFFRELYPGQTHPLVFGEGDVGAGLLLIGEAPGEQEVAQGRPFVGKAGKNLDELLALAGLERGALYITNAVKIRPTKLSAAGRVVNRPPTKEEIELFLPWLRKEIALIAPRRIATLGNVPLKALMGPKATVGAMHGEVVLREGIELFPLYHPASLIYNPGLRPLYEQDVRALGELVRGDGKGRV